jgi:lipooligosaccharide transport system permease protein
VTGLLGDVSALSFRVWRRNLAVYLVTWRTAMVSLVEPVFNFLAFGIGVGAITESVEWHGRVLSYREFVGPAIIGMSILFQSFFEALYSAFVRMYYQRTFDAITATPASLDDVVVGEALWAMTKGLIGTTATVLVLWTMGVGRTWSIAFIPLLAASGGLLFASAGLCFTGVVKNIDSINYPLHLVGVPMYLFGGLFFPVDERYMPAWAVSLSKINPMYHLSEALRACCHGQPDAHVAWTVLGLAALSVPLLALAVRLMRRRLIR